jgi:hypothetical protein
MEEYYRKLENTIRKKNLVDFWMFPDRSKFKALTHPFKKLEKMLKNDPKRYGGRNIANVTLYFDHTGLKTNKSVFHFKVVIFTLTKTGEISEKRGDSWGYMINYKLEDLYENHFKMSFMEKIIKLVANETLDGDTFNGTKYKNFIRKLDELGIDLDRI